jgi:hypothetical protein
VAAGKKEFPSEGSSQEKKNSFEEFKSLILTESNLREAFLKLFPSPTNANGMKTTHSISKALLAKYLETVINYSLIQNKNLITAEVSKLKKKNLAKDLKLVGKDKSDEAQKVTRSRIASRRAQEAIHLEGQGNNPDSKRLERLLTNSINLLKTSLSDTNNLNKRIETEGFNFHINQADSPFHHSLINDKNKIYAILNQDGLNKVKDILDVLLTKVKSASKNLNAREKEFLSNFETQTTRETYHQIFRQTALRTAAFMPKLKILLGLAN